MLLVSSVIKITNFRHHSQGKNLRFSLRILENYQFIDNICWSLVVASFMHHETDFKEFLM